MIDFYRAKREWLAAEINTDLEDLGMQQLSVKELLLMSSEPQLAETV